ncbi:hypothetical protein F5Y18DRAFT_82606 [Xylariaceae sp. FL1019]|nr:hypothetical protein F5Y18DRAFT_82606 [Xylariaceae sp. FL1019]
MAAIFGFGSAPNAFIVANGSVLDYQNLPPAYEGQFKTYAWNAMQLKAFTTGPKDYHWALKHAGDWSARGPSDMMPHLNTEIVTRGSNGLAQMGHGRVTSVAFAPNGTSWFIRYDTKQCLWGPHPDAFPSTWRSIIDDLERNHPRKDECIDFVAFGLHELLLVRFENGNSMMFLPDNPAVRNQISAEFIKEVEERLAAGWTLGNRTTLCAFDTNRWFIEWRRGSDAVFKYSMGLGDRNQEDLARVQKVLSGAGNNPAAVANNEAAQLAAANGRFATAVSVNRALFGRW